MRWQGKSLLFLILRDGTGYLQSILTDKLVRRGSAPELAAARAALTAGPPMDGPVVRQCQTYNALMLTRESTVTLYGTLKEVKEGQTAEGGHELIVDYWEVVALAPGGAESVDNFFNTEAGPDVLFDNRHMVLRGEKASKIMKMRSVVLAAFRAHFFERGYFEVTPPCLVQTQVEGGATLFSLDYYGQPVRGRLLVETGAGRWRADRNAGAAPARTACVCRVAGVPDAVVAAVPGDGDSVDGRRLLHPRVVPRRKVAHAPPPLRVRSLPPKFQPVLAPTLTGPARGSAVRPLQVHAPRGGVPVHHL